MEQGRNNIYCNKVRMRYYGQKSNFVEKQNCFRPSNIWDVILWANQC